MRTKPTLFLAALMVACGSGADGSGDSLAAGGVVNPDTQTIDGVLQMRHDGTAFDRAPQLVLDSVGVVILDGGDELDFDLTKASSAALYPDGRALVTVTGTEARLLAFGADGTRGRVVARRGQGPGDIRTPRDGMSFSTDTLLIVDLSNRRVNYVTADSGIVRARPMVEGGMLFCYEPVSALPGGWFLGLAICPSAADDMRYGHLPAQMIKIAFDYSQIDTLAMIGGIEIGTAEFQGTSEPVPLRFSPAPIVARWGEFVAASSQQPGFRIARHRTDGVLAGELVIDAPRRTSTEAMNQAQITTEADRFDSDRMPPNFAVEFRQTMEAFPVADSLPGFGKFFGDTDGLLWALQCISPVDDSWSAVALRGDGAIVGVLSAPMVLGEPVWFGYGKVVLKSTDDDGFVRFGVYGVERE